MLYSLSASPTLVVLLVLPVLLVLLYLVQRRQKQGALSFHFNVILTLHSKLVSAASANGGCIGSFQQQAQQ